MRKGKKQGSDWKPKSEMTKESFWIKIGDLVGISRCASDKKYEIPDPTKQKINE